MFVFLNRCIKAGIVCAWLAAGWWVWSQRERVRPLIDYYEVWQANGRKDPPPLPEMEGTVDRAVTDTGIFLRDGQGKLWSFGLIGIEPTSQDPRLATFAAETRTNLTKLLAGQPVRIAWTSTNLTRAGFGYLYRGTNQTGLAVEMVGSGRWRLHPVSASVLPIKEQVRLKVAEREARTRQVGLWAEGMPVQKERDPE